MAQGVKDHLGQPRALSQLLELTRDDAFLAGAAVGHRHHQIVVLVLVPQQLLQLVLGLPPLAENVGNRLGQPHLSDAGVGLGLFQDDPGAGVGKQGREDVVDVPLADHLNGPLGGPHQLLVDVDIGVVRGDVIVLDVDIVPGEPQNLADPHGAGKG